MDTQTTWIDKERLGIDGKVVEFDIASITRDGTRLFHMLLMVI